LAWETALWQRFERLIFLFPINACHFGSFAGSRNRQLSTRNFSLGRLIEVCFQRPGMKGFNVKKLFLEKRKEFSSSENASGKKEDLFHSQKTIWGKKKTFFRLKKPSREKRKVISG
jgi:hypothetical protein